VNADFRVVPRDSLANYQQANVKADPVIRHTIPVRPQRSRRAWYGGTPGSAKSARWIRGNRPNQICTIALRTKATFIMLKSGKKSTA